MKHWWVHFGLTDWIKNGLLWLVSKPNESKSTPLSPQKMTKALFRRKVCNINVFINTINPQCSGTGLLSVSVPHLSLTLETCLRQQVTTSLQLVPGCQAANSGSGTKQLRGSLSHMFKLVELSELYSEDLTALKLQHNCSFASGACVAVVWVQKTLSDPFPWGFGRLTLCGVHLRPGYFSTYRMDISSFAVTILIHL